MRDRLSALRIVFATLSLTAVAAGTTTHAEENVDPGNIGAQYSYGANVGWWNAEPSGNGGPGVNVSDSALTGYVWASNIGWISLSCQNTSSCGTGSYGVQNNGHGNLSGFAYGQNVGWIDFAPRIAGTPVAGAGVRIDPGTGVFSGKAYAANLGWINFGTYASPAVAAFQVQTSWHEATPTGTATYTAGNTATATSTNTATATPTQTSTSTATRSATATSTASSTVTPTGTPMPTQAPTSTPVLAYATGTGTGPGAGLSALYTVDPLDGASSLVWNFPSIHIYAGGLAYDATTDTLYATGVEDSSTDTSRLFTINRSTGATTSFPGLSSDINLQFGGLAIHPLTGVLYATGSNGFQSTALFTIDKNTGAATLVGQAGSGCCTSLWGLGFRSDGTLFANGYLSSPSSSHLFTVNLATGEATDIGPHGVTVGRQLNYSGLAFRDDGTLLSLGSLDAASGALYAVNTANGAATSLSGTGLPGPIKFGVDGGLAFAPAAATATETPTSTPTTTATPTHTLTMTPTPTATATPTSSPIPSFTPTSSPTPTPTDIPSPTSAPTTTPSSTSSPTSTATPTSPPAETPTLSPTPTALGENCTHSQGYWKTHPDSWPLDSLALGAQTYSAEELLALLNLPIIGDASRLLARQLIAAKLNIASGSDPSAIAADVQAADSLLDDYAGKLPYAIVIATEPGQQAVDLAYELALYNAGLLAQGPPHCSEPLSMPGTSHESVGVLSPQREEHIHLEIAPAPRNAAASSLEIVYGLALAPEEAARSSRAAALADGQEPQAVDGCQMSILRPDAVAIGPLVLLAKEARVSQPAIAGTWSFLLRGSDACRDQPYRLEVSIRSPPVGAPSPGPPGALLVLLAALLRVRRLWRHPRRR